MWSPSLNLPPFPTSGPSRDVQGQAGRSQEKVPAGGAGSGHGLDPPRPQLPSLSPRPMRFFSFAMYVGSRGFILSVRDRPVEPSLVSLFLLRQGVS